MIEYKIFTEQNLIAIQMGSNVLYRDVSELFARLLEDPHFSTELSGVVDLRKSTVDMSPEDVERLGGIAAELEISRGRWAYLADSPLSTALAILYRDKLAEIHDGEIFSTLEAASEYIGADLTPHLPA